MVQEVELVDRPVIVTEHRALTYWCAHCGKLRCARLPAEVLAAGLVGTRLTALVAWLKGTAHAAYTTIQALLRDVLAVRLSTGELARLVRKAGRALEPAYAELRQALPSQARLNVDETGHKESGKSLCSSFAARRWSVSAKTLCAPPRTRRGRRRRGTWRIGFANTPTPTSASSPRQESSPPTTWPNRPCASWSSSAASRKARRARRAAPGVSASGPRLPPADSKADLSSSSFTTHLTPISEASPPPPSCPPDRKPVNGYSNFRIRASIVRPF